MKTLLYLLGGVALVVLLMMLVTRNGGKLPGRATLPTATPTPVASSKGMTDEGMMKPVADPQNGTYLIEGESVTLVNGMHEASIPNSATKIVTSYFGNEAEGDLNGDGVSDMAFLLTQDPGGSGTFFYVTAALGSEGGYLGTNAIMIGDRIAPQSTEVNNGVVTVNYVTRAEGEAMTAEPSEAASKSFRVEGDTLVEIAK